jgi:cellulose synthase/poly-beta-1,6-N-acetylglucosamine synthase-like glycosyltransferase
VLKQLDSDFYSVVGAAGELMSYRTELYTILPDDAILDDLIQSMQIVIKGYRVVYEKNAFATETASSNINEELKRKIRISAGAWQSLPRLGKALDPFYDFKLFFLFMSHKVFRWILAPFLLLFLFVVNIFLVNQDFYFFTFLAQILFYLFALQGWYFQNKKIKLKLFFVPYYFFIMNLCMYLGLLKFLRGKQSVNWERAKRA